jgi:hypothetical protein
MRTKEMIERDMEREWKKGRSDERSLITLFVMTRMTSSDLGLHGDGRNAQNPHVQGNPYMDD